MAGQYENQRSSSPVPVLSVTEVSGDEVGPASGVRSDLKEAATGADDIAVPSVPVAAQPRYDISDKAAAFEIEKNRYILDKGAVLELVGRYAAASVEAATSGSPKGREEAREQIRDLWDAIRAALTPVPDVEPQRWDVGARQPGRKVIAVRDRDGDLWDRMYGDQGEHVDAWTAPDDPEITMSWGELLSEFGPLTDATCDTCGGKGVIDCYGSYPGGPACIDCHGTGQMPCPDCTPETPEQSAAIVDANLRAMGSAGLEGGQR